MLVKRLKPQRYSYLLRHPFIHKGLLAAAGALAMMLLVFSFYWWPVHERISKLQEAVAFHRSSLAGALRQGELAKAYKQASVTVIKLEEKLNRWTTQAQLVANVSRLAGKAGVKIVSQSYQEGKKRGNYMPLYQELVLLGTYKSIRGFLDGVDALPTYTLIEDTHLQKSLRRKGMVKARLRLVTYRVRAKQSGVADV